MKALVMNAAALRRLATGITLGLAAALAGCVPPSGNYSEFAVRGKAASAAVAGSGQVVYAEGVYQGELQGGYPHGKGTFAYRDGRRYEGGFATGRAEGQGRMTYPDGRVVTGEYRQGRERNVEIVYADGRRFRGGVQRGRANGAGTLVLPAGWAFNRTSAGWSFNATGTLAQVAADVPRFDYNPATLACRGLLLEEARTNGIRNPRAEGATPGTPGTMPQMRATSSTGMPVAAARATAAQIPVGSSSFPPLAAVGSTRRACSCRSRSASSAARAASTCTAKRVWAGPQCTLRMCSCIRNAATNSPHPGHAAWHTGREQNASTISLMSASCSSRISALARSSLATWRQAAAVTGASVVSVVAFAGLLPLPATLAYDLLVVVPPALADPPGAWVFASLCRILGGMAHSLLCLRHVAA